MNNTIYLTKQGLRKAQTELNYLIKTRRPNIMRRLKGAYGKTEGILKGEQLVVENRIIELEALINKAVIIEKVDVDKVSIGAKVTLKYLDDNTIKTYSIVGADEADLRKNKISYESPVAQALIGKKVDDVATVALRFSKFNVMIMGISTLR